jgi:hypothetical protein
MFLLRKKDGTRMRRMAQVDADFYFAAQNGWTLILLIGLIYADSYNKMQFTLQSFSSVPSESKNKIIACNNKSAKICTIRKVRVLSICCEAIK